MRMTMLLSDAAVYHVDERLSGQVDPQVGSVLTRETVRPSHHRTQLSGSSSQRRPVGDREVLSTSRGSFHMRDHIRGHRTDRPDEMDHGRSGRTGQASLVNGTPRRIDSATERHSTNNQRSNGGEIRRSEATTNYVEPSDHSLRHQQVFTDQIAMFL